MRFHRSLALLAAVTILCFLSRAHEARGQEDKIRRRIAATDATIARLDSLLVEPLATGAKFSGKQRKEIQAAIASAKRDYTQELRRINKEAFGSDNSGPEYALKKVPAMEAIVNNAYETIMSKLITPEQREIIVLEWKRLDEKKAEDAKRK